MYSTQTKNRGINMRRLSGFSLMEMMTVLLIVSVVAAASAPMINKRMMVNQAAGDCVWGTLVDGSIFYNQEADNKSVIIGASDINNNNNNNNLNPRLHIRTNNNNIPFITFQQGANNQNQLALNYRENTLGLSANEPADGGTAIGANASVGANGVAVGNAQAAGASVAIGSQARVLAGNIFQGNGSGSVAIGLLARATGEDQIAIGNGATTNLTNQIAIGREARARHYNSIALGADAIAGGDKETNSNMDTDIAIGSNARAYGDDNIAIGGTARIIRENEDTAQPLRSVALGFNTLVTGGNSIAIGESAESRAVNGVAVGWDSSASGPGSIAIGSGAVASGENSIAIGHGVSATVDKQIVLGSENDTVYIPGRLVVGGDVLLNAKKGSVVLRVYESKGGDGKPRETSKDHFDNSSGLSILTSDNFSGEDDNFKTYDDVGPNFLSTSQKNFFEEYIDKKYVTNTEKGATSDRRLKNVGKAFTSGLAEIKKLEVFNYTFKNDESKTPRVGVMAQDLQKIFPNAVTKGEDGFLRIRMEDMFYAVVNAVKELDNKFDLLAQKQKKIDELEAKLDKLEKRLEKLEKQK